MKVLFIGNSHTYVHDMPHIFQEIALKDGITVDVTMISHPGWFLAQHVDAPEARFNILYGCYDYIVLQEHTHPFGPIDKFHNAVRSLNEFVKQTSSKVIIYPTWAAKAKPEDQEVMSIAFREIAKEIGALVAPVDYNWVEARKEHNDELYGPDGEHASTFGSTLAAETIWDTIKKDIEYRK